MGGLRGWHSNFTFQNVVLLWPFLIDLSQGRLVLDVVLTPGLYSTHWREFAEYRRLCKLEPGLITLASRHFRCFYFV
jgi:hypothetical protein